MSKSAEVIRAEMEAEVEAEQRRLLEAQQQIVISEARLEGYRDALKALGVSLTPNGRRRGRPPKQR